jgi:hypothetical protein
VDRLQVGQLVGGVDREGVAVDVEDAGAVLLLALAVVLDRLVVGEGGDQAGALVPELGAELLDRESSTTS